jgi:hypothetical protein
MPHSLAREGTRLFPLLDGQNATVGCLDIAISVVCLSEGGYGLSFWRWLAVKELVKGFTNILFIQESADLGEWGSYIKASYKHYYREKSRLLLMHKHLFLNS